MSQSGLLKAFTLDETDLESLYWLVTKDPYDGLLQPVWLGVVVWSLSNPAKQVFGHPSRFPVNPCNWRDISNSYGIPLIFQKNGNKKQYISGFISAWGQSRHGVTTFFFTKMRGVTTRCWIQTTEASMEMIIIRVTTTRSNDTIVSVAYDMTSCQTFLDFFCWVKR